MSTGQPNHIVLKAIDWLKTSKNLIEKVIVQGSPLNKLLLEQRITPVSPRMPDSVEILFGRKFRSDLSVLPAQLMNPRISSIQKQCVEFTNPNQNCTWSHQQLSTLLEHQINIKKFSFLLSRVHFIVRGFRGMPPCEPNFSQFYRFLGGLSLHLNHLIA